MNSILGDLFKTIYEVIILLLPLSIFFMLFQKFYLHLPKIYIENLIKGIFLTFLGMVLFFEGVEIGFLPAGRTIGEYFGGLDYNWILIPLGFSMGFLTTYAEPAVMILCNQIEKFSNGFIQGKIIKYILSFSVAFFVSLGMVKLVYGLNLLLIIIVGYSIVLLLTLFSDKEYIAIAFDSGGVVTGPMAVTFLMAMALGAASTMEGRNPLIDGFGLISLIALAPIIPVMAFGLIIRYKGGIKDE
ncbi:MAG: hypothetical protein APG12_00852 [Candidatus Methanofastidiosum methylothiophilum]|uniref:DUF1538 domain-containing protein n=1 Tax=Candidatus Methanofastidiosum methylothiophilum TaxID=1705564 RepID=A0A150IZK5_9EURY|nr:MAG: hypothetical protein APG10_01734 [Candidatus Methanofastidiosum methylthiophilus]KYC47523.1 MAG: hypothetical protein APG11_01124 [Candidatus Methanofastidiosum methylthiophilus]KYC50423.1 MAG: hypothetical protein APG12_00852 [Candidatus Methanofastidiosum methylthiophilus]